MLKIIKNSRDLDYSQIVRVYSESLERTGKNDYPQLSENLRILSAESDLRCYIQLFLKDPDSLYAVWEYQGRYQAALRLERYLDGYIITALETAPAARRKGCARMLIASVQEWLTAQGENKLYSHIDKKNKPSMALHLSCGFQIILDYAVYVDGSVLQNSCTVCCALNEIPASMDTCP